MNPIRPWLKWYRARKAERIRINAGRRVSIILAQIERAKIENREWKPKVGELRAARTQQLRAECGMV